MDIPSYLIGAIKGASSAGVKYVVVQELPTTGEEGTIYLVPKSTSQTDNIYNEYMYINNDWELIGDTQADLSDYQEKLVSGTNIKTINNTSILGSGNLDTEIIQYSTMPTASASTVNKIVQYTGTTDSTYTNGYFYKGISTTEEVGGVETTTYSWGNINIQPGGGGGSTNYNDLLNKPSINGITLSGNKTSEDLGIADTKIIDASDTSNINTADNLRIVQEIYDNYINNKIDNVYIYSASRVGYSGDTYSKLNDIYIHVYLILDFIDTAIGREDNAYNGYYGGQYYKINHKIIKATISDGTITSLQYSSLLLACEKQDGNYIQNFLGISNTREYTPSGNYNPATKKYVDDSIASAIGTALSSSY